LRLNKLSLARHGRKSQHLRSLQDQCFCTVIWASVGC
jgi:hypothetical protein